MAYELCRTGRCTGPSSGLGGAGSLYDIFSPVNIANAGTPSRAHGLGGSIFTVARNITTAPGTQFKTGKASPFSKLLSPVLKASGAASPLLKVAAPIAAAAIPGVGVLVSPLVSGIVGGPAVTVAAPGSPVAGATPTFVPSTPTAAATVTPLASGVGVPRAGLDTKTMLILGAAAVALLLVSRR